MFRWTDYEMVPKQQTDFERIFGKRHEYVVRKSPRYRGFAGRKDMIQNLSRSEAKHFLLHHPHGRALQRDFPNIPFDQLVDHVVEASTRPMEKRKEVQTMDKHLEVILKSESAMHALCKHIADSGGSNFTHPEFDGFLARYAKNQHPALHVGNAIAKVLAEEMPVARAYQAVHSAYYPAYAVAKATAPDNLDDARDEDDEDDGADALEELERLAEQERRRSGTSKAVAFSKIYQDPMNAKLAQRERAQNRPR